MTIAERIAALPVAVNTAADFSGKLTQGTSSPVSAGKSSTETTKRSVLSSIYASDRADYTVLRTRQAMGAFPQLTCGPSEVNWT